MSNEIVAPWWRRLFTLPIISAAVCATLAVLSVVFPASLTETSQAYTTYFLEVLDWFFLFFCSACVAVCIFLIVTPYGRILLGKPGDTPEFSTPSWIAMLFAAGMGAGLLFWGVAEPLTHFVNPPDAIPEMSPAAARQAMVYANLHWGLHAWGLYALGAVVLAYFGFRKGMPMLPSGPIRAVFKGRGGRAFGNLADLVGVLSVVFGVAGSIGMGVRQIASGLHSVMGTPEQDALLWLGILALITVSYIASALTGIGRGIQILSNINVGVAVVLMLFVLFAGPSNFILGTFVTAMGDYLSQLPRLSFNLNVYSGNAEWTRSWTLTYLLWWAAWIPFVGIFVARISRGRTIRQFMIGVLVIPSLFTALWFSVFGGSALFIELFGTGGITSLLLQNTSATLFGFFQYFPLSNLLSIVALLLIFIFLVTSADSASFVVGMLSSQGTLNPSIFSKLFWGVVIALLTAAALIAGGGPEAMKAIAISGAIPFVVIALIHIVIFLRELSRERGLRSHEDDAP